MSIHSNRFFKVLMCAASAVVGLLGAAAIAVCLGSWWYYDRAVTFQTSADTVDVVVPAGASVRHIARLAKQAGLDIDEIVFLAAVRLHKSAPNIHAGRYRFERGASLAHIIDKFRNSQVESFFFRVPDGVTFWQLRELIGQAAGDDLTVTSAQMSPEELLAAIGVQESHLEGLFAPETYRFRSGSTDIDVFRAAYRTQKSNLDRAWQGRDPTIKLQNPYEALILASIIEKETSREEDRSMVSSVFHNRLRIGMPLQTDPTIIYGIGPSFNGNLTRRDLRTPGPYNTYLNQGLPPTPISMPTMASIQAALHPAQSNKLYFVAKGDGTTYFSETLAEHNKAVEQYQKLPARQKNKGAIGQ